MVPTKEQRAAVGASFNQPEGQIEPSAFFDEEAEQVRQKFLEEQKEEEEAGEMALHDKPAVGNLEVEQKPAAVTFGETVVVEDDEQPRTPPVSTQEGYFCLQTTLSLRSTKQGSTEPGLYIYVQSTSPIYTPMSPRLCAKLIYPFMIFDRLSKHASAGNFGP